MRFSFFDHQIVGRKKTNSDNNKQQSPNDKADIRIEKPTNHQGGYDTQAVIENAQVILIRSFFYNQQTQDENN
jgi:hypothetical protein